MERMLTILLVSLLFVSCRKDKVEEVTVSPEDCPETISYTDDIQTFLNVNCTTSGCHNSNSSAAGYVFESHSQVEEHAQIILSVIRHESGVSAMPQGQQKLNDTTIQKMECWISQGKLFN